MQIDPAHLGTLELDRQWVAYINLVDIDFIPTRIEIASEEYAFDGSYLVRGHGAAMPERIRELRGAGKKPVVVERSDRYYIFVTPP